MKPSNEDTGARSMALMLVVLTVIFGLLLVGMARQLSRLDRQVQSIQQQQQQGPSR